MGLLWLITASGSEDKQEAGDIAEICLGALSY